MESQLGFCNFIYKRGPNNPDYKEKGKPRFTFFYYIKNEIKVFKSIIGLKKMLAERNIFMKKSELQYFFRDYN